MREQTKELCFGKTTQAGREEVRQAGMGGTHIFKPSHSVSQKKRRSKRQKLNFNTIHKLHQKILNSSKHIYEFRKRDQEIVEATHPVKVTWSHRTAEKENKYCNIIHCRTWALTAGIWILALPPSLDAPATYLPSVSAALSIRCVKQCSPLPTLHPARITRARRKGMLHRAFRMAECMYTVLTDSSGNAIPNGTASAPTMLLPWSTRSLFHKRCTNST